MISKSSIERESSKEGGRRKEEGGRRKEEGGKEMDEPKLRERGLRRGHAGNGKGRLLVSEPLGRDGE
jgi:hypothetical protein